MPRKGCGNTIGIPHYGEHVLDVTNGHHALNASRVFDERGRSIAWMARTVLRLYNATAQRVLDREGISIAHWYYLRVLSQYGTLNQRELSKRVEIAPTTAVTALDALEKRGLVRRERDTTDRRRQFVSLTDEGARLIDVLMPEIEKLMAASVQGIPETDMRTFWMVLHKIYETLLETAGDESVLD